MISWLFLGEHVEVRGISQKGRNRVNEHGSIWKISKVVSNGILGIMPTGSVLLESTDNKNYFRWVKPDDKDFDIIRVVDSNNI